MDRVNVTKSFLPPLDEYQKYLKRIWQNGQLTNQGPLVKEFETKAMDYLGVKNFHFLANGTLALQLALRALKIDGGEVITTPFSYVASTSAILWERCTPVFVDIDPETLCIDAGKIEAAITGNTKAILAVHVFGIACDLEAIDKVAKKHNLKVIYDGAHAFGVQYHGKSLLDYGDIATCSFHATKLFHTIEGGAIITPHEDISADIELMKRFGHNGDEHIQLGINAKATEVQAAMGLCNLKYIDQIIEKRKSISEKYDQLLGTNVKKPKIAADVKYNYAYYPVIFDSEAQLLGKMDALKRENIFPRRYFYPSLNQLPYLERSQACPVSEDVARRVLCLPLHAELEPKTVGRIAEMVKL